MRSSGSFVKGKSGNPGGRSKAYAEVARHIRDKTKNGIELADIVLKIARNAKAEPRARLLAVEFLADRGLGKTVLAVDLHVEGEVGMTAAAPVDWSKVPIERRRALLEALTDLNQIADESSHERNEGTEH